MRQILVHFLSNLHKYLPPIHVYNRGCAIVFENKENACYINLKKIHVQYVNNI